MKTYSERIAEVTGKMREIRRRSVQKRLSIAVAAAAVLTLVLFFPLNVEPPNVRAYSDSPYYELIKKIDQANGGKPGYKNLFDAITQKFTDQPVETKDDIITDVPTLPPEIDQMEESEDPYVDMNFADNSLPGVTDGETVLYTDDYIFRLNYNLLKAFSLDGAESKKISEYRINAKMLYVDGEYEKYEYFVGPMQMFLSEDGTKITVVIGVWWGLEPKQEYTLLLQLDVSDPENIQEIDRIYVSGTLHNVWLVDGELLIVGEYEVGVVTDYSDVATYVPLAGKAEQMKPIPAEDILVGESGASLCYLVLYKVNIDTFEINDRLAMVSRNRHVNVCLKEEYLFTTCTVWYEKDNMLIAPKEGDLTCFRYRDELTYVSSTTLPGEYAGLMNLHDGVLWVFTARSTERLPQYNLYCLEMPNLNVLSVTEDITPKGRPGAIVIYGDLLGFQNRGFTSGIYDSYIYDLSNPKNVTCQEGELTTQLKEKLVKWTDGYWLGIRTSDKEREYHMTLELYRETDAGLSPSGKYEIDGKFISGKDTLCIDPERGLLGMFVRVELIPGKYTSFCEDRYLLLKFTDGQWEEAAHHSGGNYRPVLQDDWLYMVYNDIKAIPLS